MRHSLLIYAAIFLFGLLFCYTGHDQSKEGSDGYRGQENSQLNDPNSTLVDHRVIYAANAPTRITRKIKQDKEGNLLIASYEGIIKYDGNSPSNEQASFINFTKEKGLDECYAFDVLEDKKGNIWIASDQEGVYRYDHTTDLFTHFTTKDGLGHRRNMCIYEDQAGNIWVGGQGGLSRYCPSVETSSNHEGIRTGKKPFENFTIKDGLPHNDVNCILEDRTGKIWVGTRGNAGVYDPVKNEEEKHTTGRPKFLEIRNKEGMPFFNVWSITEDRKGNIWLADTVGLWNYHPSAGPVQANESWKDGASFTLVSKDTWGLYEDKLGNYWTTDMPRFQPATLSQIDAKTLFSGTVNTTEVFKTNGVFLGISEDSQGNIWVGGTDGVWCYDGKTVKYFTGKLTKDK